MSNEPKLLPASIEAEQALIGSILLDSYAFTKVADFIKPKDFYKFNHQIIYEAFCDLRSKNFEIDILLVSEHLRFKNKLEEVGGLAYLSSLTDHAPIAANAPYYARIVKDKKIRRDLIMNAYKIQESAHTSEEDISKIMADSFAAITSLEQLQDSDIDIGDAATEVITSILERQGRDNQMIGYPTGIKSLDEYTLGIRKNSFVVIAALIGGGKTSFALFIALYMATLKIPVAYYSLEMSEIELVERLIPMCSQGQEVFTATDMTSTRLSDDKIDTLTKIRERIAELPLFFKSISNYQELMLNIEKQRQENGIKIVIVDYLQLLDDSDDPKALAKYTRGMKLYAMGRDIPVIVLSQYNRNSVVRQDKMPTDSDLKGSGTIAADADQVIFLHKPPEQNEDDEKKGKKNSLAKYFNKNRTEKDLLLILHKFRQGMSNKPKYFNITFDENIRRYFDNE